MARQYDGRLVSYLELSDPCSKCDVKSAPVVMEIIKRISEKQNMLKIVSEKDAQHALEVDDESPPFITQQSSEEPRQSKILENVPSISQNKEAKRYRAPLPGTLDKVKKLEFKKKILKFKTSLALDDYKNADLLLEDMARHHGGEVYLWRKILSFCYKQDVKIARQFITTIKTANPYCINGIVFNSVIAEQECRYGDSALGRKSFEKLASQYSERILHHFVPYLHYLCDVKDYTYARIFLKKNIHKVEHQYNLIKLKKEVKTLERVYDCKLL